MNSILLSHLYHILHISHFWEHLFLCLSESNPHFPSSHLLWACLEVCSIFFPQSPASLAHHFQVTMNVNFLRAFQLIYGNNLCFRKTIIYYEFRWLFIFFFGLCMIQEYLWSVFMCGTIFLHNLLTASSSKLGRGAVNYLNHKSFLPAGIIYRNSQSQFKQSYSLNFLMLICHSSYCCSSCETVLWCLNSQKKEHHVSKTQICNIWSKKDKYLKYAT